MKRVFAVMLVIMIVVLTNCMIAFAENEENLDDVIKEVENNVETKAIPVEAETGKLGTGAADVDRTKENAEFIQGMQDATNLDPDVEGANTVLAGVKVVASFVVTVISYVIITFMSIRIMLDLLYITLPFTRSFFANGYTGNPQSTGDPAVGMNGMPMNGMGGMPGVGMGSMSNMRGMGNRGFGGMSPAVNMNQNMASMNQGQTALGKIQWVSNDALNAVATESTVGPDGKTQSPFKVYASKMVVMLISVPILITLAATGAIANLGFIIADALVDGISRLGLMI